MKNRFIVLLVLITVLVGALFGLTACTQPTEQPSKDDEQTQTNQPADQTEFVFMECEGGYALMRYVGNKRVVEVPSTYNGKPVVSIGLSEIDGFCGFYDCATVEKIVLPNTIEGIYYGVFTQCFSLKEINIPSSVKIINQPFEGVFYSGEPIVSNINVIVDSFENFVQIDGDLFEGVQELYKSVDITVGGAKIDVENLVIPQGVKKIGNILQGLNIKNVTIPEGVEEISNSAFRGCKLQSVTIPASVTKIGYYAFYCDSLTSVTFADTSNWRVSDVLVLMDDSNQLSNPSIAAEYLKSTYCGYNWIKLTKVQSATIKELKLNPSAYTELVSFEGTIVKKSSSELYVQSYDIQDDLYYGIFIRYEQNSLVATDSKFAEGNTFRFVGLLSSGYILGLQYNPTSTNSNNTVLLKENQTVVFTPLTEQLFNSQYSYVNQDNTTSTFTFQDIAQYMSISCGNLVVERVEYYSDLGGWHLTCTWGTRTVNISIDKLYVNNDPSQGELEYNWEIRDSLVGKSMIVTKGLMYITSDSSFRIAAMFVEIV